MWGVYWEAGSRFECKLVTLSKRLLREERFVNCSGVKKPPDHPGVPGGIALLV